MVHRRGHRTHIGHHRRRRCRGFSVAPGRIFYSHGSLAGPAQLFSVGLAGGRPEQLTDLNHALLAERKLGEFEQFSFAGSHDDSVFAYVIKPAQFKRGHKYPVALLVHGGPQGSLANDWHWRWNAQTFAGAGVPDSQGLSVFTALQRRAVPSELLYFPNENHFVQKPADSIQWYDTTLAWLNRWAHP